MKTNCGGAMKRLSDFIALYRIYRNHYHCLNAARYAWIVSGEISPKKD